MELTVASLLMSSSVAPNEASPISCENCAKLWFASSGMWPSNSWQQSLKCGGPAWRMSNYKIIGCRLRFRCVERIRWMSYVLCAMEHSERQARKEVPRRQVTSNRTQLKASFTLQKYIDVLQLGQIILTIAAILLQLWPIFHIFWHRMLHIQFL